MNRRNFLKRTGGAIAAAIAICVPVKAIAKKDEAIDRVVANDEMYTAGLIERLEANTLKSNSTLKLDTWFEDINGVMSEKNEIIADIPWFVSKEINHVQRS